MLVILTLLLLVFAFAVVALHGGNTQLKTERDMYRGETLKARVEIDELEDYNNTLLLTNSGLQARVDALEPLLRQATELFGDPPWSAPNQDPLPPAFEPGRRGTGLVVLGGEDHEQPAP